MGIVGGIVGVNGAKPRKNVISLGICCFVTDYNQNAKFHLFYFSVTRTVVFLRNI